MRLGTKPIRPEDLVSAVGSAGDGAVALFLGTVRARNEGREVLHLEYDAYAEMADAEIEKIELAAVERFEVSRIAVAHRTGRLEIGEVAVGVAVAAPHRGPAMEACRFVIDSLKRTVPIWKKEFFRGGEVWIEEPRPAPESADPQA